MNPNQSNPTSQAENSLFNKKTVLLAVVITILVIGLIPTRLLRNYLSSTPTPTPTAEISANTPTPAPPTPTIAPTNAEPDPTAEPTEPSPTEPNEEPTAEPTEEPTPSTSESPAASFTPPDNLTPSPTPTDTPETPTPTHTPETPVVVAQPCPVILIGPPDSESFSSEEEIRLEWESPQGRLGFRDYYRVSFRNTSGEEIDAFITKETSSVKEGGRYIARWPRPDDGEWLQNVRQGDSYKWTVAIQREEEILCEAEEVRGFTWGLN